MKFILQGIISHKQFTRDKFLQRKLSEIIRIYLAKYEAGVSHPMQCLLVSGHDPVSCLVAELCLEEINKVSRECLTRNKSISVNCLKYLDHCLQSPPPHLTELLISRSLTSLLDLLSSSHDKSVRNPIISILKIILSHDSVLWHQEIITRKLQTYVKSNLGFYSDKVFNTLKVINMLNSEVISSMIPSLSVEVENVEKKRGTGADSKLRKALSDLEKNVIN